VSAAARLPAHTAVLTDPSGRCLKAIQKTELLASFAALRFLQASRPVAASPQAPIRQQHQKQQAGSQQGRHANAGPYSSCTAAYSHQGPRPGYAWVSRQMDAVPVPAGRSIALLQTAETLRRTYMHTAPLSQGKMMCQLYHCCFCTIINSRAVATDVNVALHVTLCCT